MLDEIRRRYPLARPDADGIRLVLGIGEGERQVRVGLRLRVVETAKGQALVVRAFIGARTLVEPSTALAINAHLLHGALATDGTDLLLHSVFLAGRSRMTAEEHLHEVATEAARLKASLRRVPGDHDVFDAYRE
jgi:hypothetical protein